MANKIVLISDDSDFFDFIRPKLELRKSDELFTFSYDSIIEKLNIINSAVLLVNSENAKEKCLDLLKILDDLPTIVFAYNDDDTYRRKCYRAGAIDFLPILVSDAEFRARMIPALSISALLEKKSQYREVLVNNNILNSTNEVFVDYNYVLDKELSLIHSGVKKAVFAAISPNEKSKFLLNPSTIEAILLNNIRKNDIIMNYAPNKYFLLMFDTDINSAKKIWQKIALKFPEKVYAGLCTVSNQKRQQLINEVLNKLHEAINFDKNILNSNIESLNNSSANLPQAEMYSNFKMFKQDFKRKVENVMIPVFYQIQQKYANKLTGVSIEQNIGDGFGCFYIKNKFSTSCFRLTSPGFSKINIDITYQKDSNIDAKRITIDPEELEQGLLEDLLEQFILEYKRGLDNDN